MVRYKLNKTSRVYISSLCGAVATAKTHPMTIKHVLKISVRVSFSPSINEAIKQFETTVQLPKGATILCAPNDNATKSNKAAVTMKVNPRIQRSRIVHFFALSEARHMRDSFCNVIPKFDKVEAPIAITTAIIQEYENEEGLSDIFDWYQLQFKLDKCSNESYERLRLICLFEKFTMGRRLIPS